MKYRARLLLKIANKDRFIKRNNYRVYLFLKFADIEDSIRTLEVALSEAEEVEDKEAIIDRVKSLSKISERDCGRAVGAILGMLKKRKKVSLQSVENLDVFKSKKVEQAPSKEKEKPKENIKELLQQVLFEPGEDNPALTIRYVESLNPLLKNIAVGLILNKSVNTFEINPIMDKISKLHVKYQRWFDSRFGRNAETKELHPIKDCLPILEEYSSADSGIAIKYAENELFKKEINENIKKPIEEVRNLSSDEMLKVLDIYRTIDLTVDADTIKKLTTLPLEDKIGEVGEWELWLPRNRENSVAAARVDRKLDPKTTWCTARTKSSNLFYNYIGLTKGKTMLFYIIKKDPKDIEDWLSIGFINKKPVLPCQDGSMSVDANNKGLNEGRLRKILGSSEYSEIMNKLQTKCNELDGVSPAYTLIEEASIDSEKFKKMIKGNSEEEAIDFSSVMLKGFSPAKEVLLEMIDIVEV